MSTANTTMNKTAIFTAVQLLRQAAEELQQSHTTSRDRNDWTGEEGAKASYDEHMAVAAALEALRDRITELEAEVDAERRHHGIRNASAVRTLHELGYSWRGAHAWQPPAPQAAVPLPLLVRDIARDLGITVPQACIALKPLGNYSTNSAVTAEMARMLRDHFPAPVHPADGVPQVSIEKLEDWKRRVNTLATCGLKADRYRVGSALKQEIADAITAQPAAQGTHAQVIEALEDAQSVLRSINMGKQHKIVQPDGEVGYLQRDEWCKWAYGEVSEKVTSALAAAQGMGAQQYRLIERGELIEAGDQFLRDDFTWQIDPRGIFVGVPHGAALRPARRALAAQAKQGGAA